MAKDYAKGTFSASRASKRSRSKTSTTNPKIKNNTNLSRPKMVLIGGFLLAGTLLGLFIAGLLYLSQHKGHHNVTKQQGTTPHHLGHLIHKAKHKQTQKAHFDFYTILQNKKVNNPQQKKPAQVAVKDDAQFILQVASVKKTKDAERLRAQLILLGYHVYISKSHAGKIAWHRVNIGPFKTLEEAQHKKNGLKKSHINSLLLKRHLS